MASIGRASVRRLYMALMKGQPATVDGTGGLCLALGGGEDYKESIGMEPSPASLTVYLPGVRLVVQHPYFGLDFMDSDRLRVQTFDDETEGPRTVLEVAIRGSN